MSKEDFLQKHWKYYLLLEEKVISLERYVAFDAKNLKSFSNEIMMIIISVCCEIDIVCKLILNFAPDKFKTMLNYKKGLTSDKKYEDIMNEELQLIENKSFELKPFKDFNKRIPSWWTAYNCLKHNRINNFAKANLNNLLNALGALYILEIYYYNNEFYKNSSDSNVPDELSKLFLTKLLEPNIINAFSGIISDEW